MLWWTLQNLLIAACLAAIVWLVCRVRRIGPAARHALWLVVLLKLVTPPLVIWPWAIPEFWRVESQGLPADRIPQAGARAGALAEPTERPATADLIVASPLPSGGSPAMDDTADPSSENFPPEALPVIGTAEIGASPMTTASMDKNSMKLSSTLPADWLLSLAGLVWLIGGIALATIQIARIGRMARRLRTARPADESLLRQVDELAQRLSMNRPSTRVVAGIGTPLIWALGRPSLLWPAELLPSLSRVARQGLIVHELAHVKRRDHWVGWLELVAGCVWWWNPLFWYVRHQLRENAELACDAWVVGTLPKGRRAYAEALLLVCQGMSQTTAPLLAVGVSTGGRRILERRLTMILSDRIAFRLSRGGVFVVLLLTACALPAWSQKPPGSGVTEVVLPPGATLEVLPLTTAVDELQPTTSAVNYLFGSAVADGMPADAQEMLNRFDREQAEIEREAEKKIAERRQELLRQLKELQDRYTRAAQLDEAVVIRDRIRQLNSGTAGSPTGYADPGNLYSLRDRIGQTLHFQVVGTIIPPIFGTDIYTDDSSLSTAAVHAGVLRHGEPGVVRVTIVPGLANYPSTTRNGVTSYGWGKWDVAYRIEGARGPAAIQPTIMSTSSGNLFHLRKQVGQTFTFDVVGSSKGYVFGTDVYSDDSPIATAAVHAGLLQSGQRGLVQAKILPGQPSYEASTRNGVTSHRWGNWGGSYSLQSVTPFGGSSLQSVPGLPGTSAIKIRHPGLVAYPSVPATDVGSSVTHSAFLSSAVGSVLHMQVTGSTTGFVWGTDVYTADSSLPAAAVHAGVLRERERGQVKVTIVEGGSSYTGSSRYGVISHPWGTYSKSFRVERALNEVVEPKP